MPYFTTDELRALPDMDEDDRSFTNERLVAAHDWIVAIIERECDTSFIPHTVTEILNGNSGRALFLSAPYILSITSVEVDGVAVDDSTLVVQNGALYQPFGALWVATDLANVSVTYEAGYSTTPPGDLKDAALRAARNWVLTMDAWSGVDERSTSLTNEYGNVNLSIAGPDRPTGLPAVDAVIMGWARRVRVPKVS